MRPICMPGRPPGGGMPRPRGSIFLGLVTMVFNLFFINLVVSGLHSYAGLN